MSDNNENFADQPLSIGELRAEKEHDALKWTPRDLLIDALRRIDNGKDIPERMVLVWQGKNGTDQWSVIRWSTAGTDRMSAIGLVTSAQIDLASDTRP